MTGYLLIGCAAKAKGLTIVTHNIKHFEHIEGLDIISPDFVNDSPDLTSPPGWLGQTGG